MNGWLIVCAAVGGVLCVTRSTHARDLEPPRWSVQLSAEAGVGMREANLPREGVAYQIRTGLYPALGLTFQLDHQPSQRFGIGLVARYQSSVGLVLREQLTGGVEHARKTRSHHAEVALAPRLHVGPAGWVVSAALGYSISELDPENHLLTPSYHLAGPFARVGLRVPLGTPNFALSVAPEAQLTVQVGDELRALSAAGSGIGLGASAAIELRFGPRWLVSVAYRELHSWLAMSQGSRFEDNLRIATAQLRGQL